jgi:hypothetical protein
MEEWWFWAYNCSLGDVASRHPEMKGGDVVVWVIAKLESWDQAVEVANNFRALANLSAPRSLPDGFWHDKMLVPVVSSTDLFVSKVLGVRSMSAGVGVGWPFFARAHVFSS